MIDTKNSINQKDKDETLSEVHDVGLPNGTSVYVPTDSPQRAGLRPVLSESEVEEVVSRFNIGRMNLPKPWAARHRLTTEILSSGDPYQIAVLASELYRWDIDMSLSDLDRKAYSLALRLLSSEISAVLGITKEEALLILFGEKGALTKLIKKIQPELFIEDALRANSLINRLATELGSYEAVDNYLTTKDEELGGETPLYFIKKQGLDALEKLASWMEETAFG